jgi:hypothetical protein
VKLYYRQGSRENRLITPALRAAEGLGLLGYEVVPYVDQVPVIEDNETMVAGFIEDVRGAVLQLTGSKPETFNYPYELAQFTLRSTWVTTLGAIRSNSTIWPVFIKPYEESKTFTGVLVTASRHVLRTAGLPSETKVWASSPVRFVSEYRCFVQRGEVVGCRFYKGDTLVFPDAGVIRAMVAAWATSPAAYCLDVGVLDDGRTALVEVNDGYAAGDYGLDSLIYARWLEARWCELTGMRPIP